MQVAEKVANPSQGTRADELLKKHEQLLGARKNFESTWQTLHDYFYLESPNINKSYAPGSELDASYLWDATTLEASDVFASGFMNYLTPATSKWARLKHKDPDIAGNKRVADFFDDVTNECHYALNRSNFYDQMFPSYKSSGVLGTSALFEDEDEIDDIRFSSIPLNQLVFTEDANGRPLSFYLTYEYTAKQAETKFGLSVLSNEMQAELKNQGTPEKKHKFVLYIGKRYVRELQKSDNKNMPIEACWIDVASKKIVNESGYNEFPVFVHRFDKVPFQAWGFSPAMKALPFARILNAVAKTNLRAMMKHTDPPLALPDNAFISPFNMNPRALNYYRKDSMTGKDIFPLGNFGDPKFGLQTVEYYSGKVKTLMYNDVFLAFNQITKDMNNPEVAERINEKMTMLGPAVGRYLSEVLPLVFHRTIGILGRKGKLPAPPPELIDNPNYEVDFVGMLAQAQKRSELNTMMSSISVAGQIAQFAPEVLDKIDPDKIIDEVWSITGASVHVLRDEAQIQEIRKGRAERQQQIAQMQEAQVGADVAKNAGAATAGFAKAKESTKK